MGPMDRNEIPFESVKVNGLMAILKGDGVARVCMNMSMELHFVPVRECLMRIDLR